ncbi:nucleotidyltransferase domain-containing protein [Microlunatus sp. GCM10028923]|uniref:nucleotidyltransferase domain-containing protein n=1 Tax=Microlunatus sp. GCM10028923 TaxID=3273400 RepID=UPI00360E2CA4
MIDFELVDLARGLVRDRFPHLRAAWLGGSFVSETATPTSDLDLTVLLPGPPAPYRESLRYEGYPVEVFVQTEQSLSHFCDKGLETRRPTMIRLVGESIILADHDGTGASWQRRCLDWLRTGPEPLSQAEVDARRYRITDLLDDLRGAQDQDRIGMIGSGLLESSADLLLSGSKRWVGGGKALVTELERMDKETGSRWLDDLLGATRSAWTGDPGPIAKVSEQILDQFGGPLFEGFRAEARIPTAYS